MRDEDMRCGIGRNAQRRQVSTIPNPPQPRFVSSTIRTGCSGPISFQRLSDEDHLDLVAHPFALCPDRWTCFFCVKDAALCAWLGWPVERAPTCRSGRFQHQLILRRARSPPLSPFRHWFTHEMTRLGANQLSSVAPVSSSRVGVRKRNRLLLIFGVSARYDETPFRNRPALSRLRMPLFHSYLQSHFASTDIDVVWSGLPYVSVNALPVERGRSLALVA